MPEVVSAPEAFLIVQHGQPIVQGEVPEGFLLKGQGLAQAAGLQEATGATWWACLQSQGEEAIRGGQPASTPGAGVLCVLASCLSHLPEQPDPKLEWPGREGGWVEGPGQGRGMAGFLLPCSIFRQDLATWAMLCSFPPS